MVSWERYAIWWQIFPLGFLGAEATIERADSDVQHRLPRLIPWLDYAVELGASGLALGPVFASESHGYDTTDHLRIDPRLGDDADFDALVEAAHERGLRVMLDGVFNHVGRSFAQFQQVVDEGPGAAAESWFRLRWPDGAVAGTMPEPDLFEGQTALVSLNHDSPAVAEHVATVMEHWLARGADAWRLDAAYAVPPSFWAKVLPRVRAAHPDVYVVGEVIHGDYPAIVAESGMDSITQYELWKAIWSSLNDHNLFELAWSLDRHNDLLDSFVPLTFVGNHDVTRIASTLADDRLLPHALVILMTVAGTPSVYYGDEQAFRGVKEERLGGDDAIRPAFPAGPRDLAPHGTEVFHLHQELIGLRRRHDWLHRATTTIVHLDNAQMVYEARAEDHALLVALNLADDPADLPAPGATDLAAGSATLLREPGPARVHLPGCGWAVLET